MAYRKTEKILAGIEKRRAKIIASAIALIGKNGIEALTMSGIAEHAKVAEGLVYKYFPDKTEVVAQAVSFVARATVIEMNQAAESKKDAIAALAASLLVFYQDNHERKPHLVRWLAAEPIYRHEIAVEIENRIRDALDLSPKDASLAAAGALGALYGIHGRAGSSKKAVLFALRGIGIKESALA